jgi:hypothetical protein
VPHVCKSVAIRAKFLVAIVKEPIAGKYFILHFVFSGEHIGTAVTL